MLLGHAGLLMNRLQPGETCSRYHTIHNSLDENSPIEKLSPHTF